MIILEKFNKSLEKETVIDGIKAPWVRILLPRTQWIENLPEYGLVSGGYLEKEQSPFSKTKINIKAYLTACDWKRDNGSCCECFYPNHYALSLNFDSERFDRKWFWDYSRNLLVVDWNSPYDDSKDRVEYSVLIYDEKHLELIKKTYQFNKGFSGIL